MNNSTVSFNMSLLLSYPGSRAICKLLPTTQDQASNLLSESIPVLESPLAWSDVLVTRGQIYKSSDMLGELSNKEDRLRGANADARHE